MPFTFKGCGTKYYGEADRRRDQSFVTTEWIVVAYAPLIPLRTLRICRDRTADVNVIIARSEGYLVLERLPLSWAQVFRTYAFVLFCLLWWSTTIWLLFFKTGRWANDHLMISIISYVVIAALPFFWLRWHLNERYKSRYG
jgi:hypothetical protein